MEQLHIRNIVLKINLTRIITFNLFFIYLSPYETIFILNETYPFKFKIVF